MSRDEIQERYNFYLGTARIYAQSSKKKMKMQFLKFLRFFPKIFLYVGLFLLFISFGTSSGKIYTKSTEEVSSLVCKIIAFLIDTYLSRDKANCS